MLKSLVKILGLVIGLILSSYSYAISMGDINVTNTLGEPMNVLIELGTAKKNEISSLSARLAPPKVFEEVGLDYPSGLPPLNFKIKTNANGEAYLKITSTEPINEPFVNLLVELTWPSGRLVREYTFLLDPPGYVPAHPKPTKVKPVEPSIVEVAELKSKTNIETIKSPQPSNALMVNKKKAADEIPAAVHKPSASSHVASGSIKVNRGDTLRKIALQTKSPDVSLERALIALYHANTDAFDGNNMNRLRIGQILRIPEQSGLDNLSQLKAVQEIRAQADDWYAYRQKLAAASGLATGNESKHESSGKISTTVADNATEAKASAKEVVRLSKGEAPGDKSSVSGNAKALQNKIHALEEEAISQSKALQESNGRVAALEKNIQDLQRLISLKTPPPVEQAKPAENPAATKLDEAHPGTTLQVPVVASKIEDVSPAATVSPVKPVIPKEKPKLVATRPPLLEIILSEPLYMIGGAAVLLGLIGLIYALTRRGKDSKEKSKLGGKPIEHVIGSFNQTLMPTPFPPDAGNSTNTIATTNDTNQAPPDDFDPISGADLFLNFGREEQAEKILLEGLSKNPTNHQIHLKLLSIYANRKDTSSFATIARQLQDSGDTKAWEQAAIMGFALEPNNPMYGSAVSETEEKSFDATPSPNAILNEGKTNKALSALDFDLDLGFGAPAASLNSAETSLSNSDSKNETIDFDVTASHVKLPASSIRKGETFSINSLNDSILDLTADDTFTPATTLEKTEIAAPANVNNAMDFDVTALNAKLPTSSTHKGETSSINNLNDSILDLTADETSTPATTLEKTEVAAPAIVNKTMDFMLDFPDTNKSVDKLVIHPVKAAPKEILDIGLGDISLNLDKPDVLTPTLSAEERDARWHDAATKLDLAKAYQEMGDAAGAREILEEVVREGDEQHRTVAEALLQQLPV